MKDLLLSLLVAGLLPTAPVRAEDLVSAGDPVPKPNVVLILTDDQGWTGTSVAMDPSLPDSASDFYETPALAQLAAQGMRFSHAYAPAAICQPSRASINTGRSPASLGITKNQNVNPPSIPGGIMTLAHAIKSADPQYATALFGKWHLGGDPTSAGYDVHDVGAYAQHDPVTNPKDIFGISDRAEMFIRDQHAAGIPFFVQIAHQAPHLFVEALAATTAKYESKPPGQRHGSPDYAAMTEDLDTGVGQILGVLDELGIAEHTYVVFMSDNGGINGAVVNNNLPLSAGKGKLWEGGIRVPLIVRGPGIAPDVVSPAPVIGYDLMPTILDWVGSGASVPSGVEGGSLRPVLEAPDGYGSVARARPELVWHFPHWRSVTQGSQVRPHSAIQVTEAGAIYKLIRVYAVAGEPSDTLHLYNLMADPGETTDLAPQDPQRAANYLQLLDQYLVDVGAQTTPDNKPPAGCGMGTGQAALFMLPISWLARRRRRCRMTDH